MNDLIVLSRPECGEIFHEISDVEVPRRATASRGLVQRQLSPKYRYVTGGGERRQPRRGVAAAEHASRRYIRQLDNHGFRPSVVV